LRLKIACFYTFFIFGLTACAPASMDVYQMASGHFEKPDSKFRNSIFVVIQRSDVLLDNFSEAVTHSIEKNYLLAKTSSEASYRLDVTLEALKPHETDKIVEVESTISYLLVRISTDEKLVFKTIHKRIPVEIPELPTVADQMSENVGPAVRAGIFSLIVGANAVAATPAFTDDFKRISTDSPKEAALREATQDSISQNLTEFLRFLYKI